MVNPELNLNPSQALSQLSRALDLAPKSEPALVFFIGSGGSGKSTLAIAFRDLMNREDVGAVRFDDAQKDFGLARWSDHIGDYSDREACIREHVSQWIDALLNAHQEKKLLICDINTVPDTLLNIMSAHPEIRFRLVLVQPTDEVRCARLANDESRQYMPKEELLAQFDSAFPNFLAERAKHLRLPRIFNEDRYRSIAEVALLANELVREAV